MYILIVTDSFTVSKNSVEQLFGSRLRVKILRLLFRNEIDFFDLDQLSERVQESKDAVKKELAELMAMGLVRSKKHF